MPRKRRSPSRIRIQQTLNATPRLLKVMAESNPIVTSAFSPDSRFIATLEPRRGRLVVRDVNSGEIVWHTENGSSE